VKPGDLVTTSYFPTETHIVRRITYVIHDQRCKSGLRAGADGGMACRECGKRRGKPVPMIDADNYKEVKK
jgi:hypothetical protein